MGDFYGDLQAGKLLPGFSVFHLMLSISYVCFPLNEGYRVVIHNLYILRSILKTPLNFSTSKSPDPLLLDQILEHI